MHRPLPRLPLLAAALVLLASCGGPTLYVEVVIPRLEVTLPGQVVPAFTGTPTPATTCGPNCIFTELSYDLGDGVPLLGDKNVEVDLRMTSLSLLVETAGQKLDGVESVTLKLVNPADPADTVIAASYVRTELGLTSFTVSGNANLDLGRYLDGSAFKARAELVYDAATPEFTATVGATFSLVLKVDYGAYLF